MNEVRALSSTVKIFAVVIGIIVVGALLLITNRAGNNTELNFGSNVHQTTDTQEESPMSEAETPGEQENMADDTSRSPSATGDPGVSFLVTEYGTAGDLSDKYLTPQDFNRFEKPEPSETRYLDSLDIPDLNALLSPDGIPSIDSPGYESVEDADKWLADEDIVLTVEHEGIRRAYATRILNWHEIVNDTFGSTPVAITFCPLCNSGLTFIRPEIDGEVVEFGTSGRIYKSDLVMYDRTTLTFWSQIEGRPIVGPLVGTHNRLDQIPTGMTRWSAWKEAYPDSEVLSRPMTDWAMGGSSATDSSGQAKPYPRDYDRNPYVSYITDNNDTFGTAFNDRRLPAKADVVGIRIDDVHAKAYLKEAVKEKRLLNDSFANTPLLVLWDVSAEDIRIFSRVVDGDEIQFALDDSGELINAENGEAVDIAGLEEIVGMTTFWFAWFNFHPETELYAGS